ncbi:unnamed protein product [Psylliodes chrysocephalus]|uniref:Uncharacterized protein n=1 Tax=Psylliodes chrysocephalus TaxID=3402493 RepID=A0A9P0GCL3_9CUCU|nr:unnamed protein product [Psylliodes chrysocephala]
MITQFKTSRINIIFDQYFTPSIKDCERTRRDESVSPVSIGPNQIRLQNFTAQPKNIQFKEPLVNFFINHWSTDDMAPLIGNKTIYLSLNECYCYRVEDNKVIMTKDDLLSCEEHEEADSRIIYHICQINFEADVVIRCSDILLILPGNMDHLSASLKLWITMGVVNHQRYVNINHMYNILGNTISKALPGFHAMTGCNYIPAFFRKGKLKPFKLLIKSVYYQLAFQNLATDDEEILKDAFVTLEKFVCHMYGIRNNSNVNDVRFHLFSTTYQSKNFNDNFEKKFKNFDPSSLPPCKVELQQHLLRVRYVTVLEKCLLKIPHVVITTSLRLDNERQQI